MKIDGNILYAPCPCGSGKKFKFCCMQTVRDYLPDNPEDAIDRIEREFGLQA